MVSLTSGPPDLMASAAVASPPLADVAFIDADGDAAATDSDASERAEVAGPPTAPPPPEPDQTPEPIAGSAAGTPVAPVPTPLKSALRRGSGRRRLQVVINESRNTYCEAAPATEEAPLLVRALSLRLPEVLSCQPAGAVTLSPPDAYRHMVAAGELFQETVVDDSEGSECSADGPEAPAGPAPLARLDEDIGLEASVGAIPESARADDPEADSDRTEEHQPRLMEPCTEDDAETHGGQTWEDELFKPFDEATLEETEGHVGAATENAVLEATGSIHVQSDCVAASKDTEEHAEGIAQRQAETPGSDDSEPCTPSPEPADRTPPSAWRNLPDLVTDGARAAAGPDTGRPAVLTIANVQQHDKVMEIADSGAEGLLSGILKGGRLWTGGRAGESEDGGGGRSVRFGRPPAPAPRLVLPPATDGDGRSSPSSVDTVIARDGAAPSAPLSAPLLAEHGEPGSDGGEASGDSASLDALRQRALAELALAAGLSRSTRSDVARAIEHNSLRRSLARVSELRLSQASGDPGAAAHDPSARLAVFGSHDRSLSGGGGGRDTTSPPRETPPPPPPGRPGSLFSPPPDIEVPVDVREWKMSETLWPDPAPAPGTPSAPDSPPATDPAPASDPVPTIAPVPNTALVPDTDPVPPVSDPVPPAPAPALDPAPAVSPAPAPAPAPVAAPAPAPAPRTPEADRDRAAPRPVQRLDSLLSSGPAESVPGLAASPQPRRPPPEPRRLQFVSPAGGREAADSRIQLAAQQLFSQPAQESGSPAGRQTLAPSYRPAAQPLPSSELARQSDGRAAEQFVERQLRQQVQHRSQHAPAGRHVRQLSDRFEQQQQQLTEAAPADLSRLPQHPAGLRHSAASSADSRDSQESRDSKDSRDSYSLDDIDDALAEPVPAVSPSPVKAGSADSGYGSAGGQVGAELDELAAFAEREAARTERLRERYAAAAGEQDGGFARRASVRGIKPRFECTSEILRQLQAGPAPHWSRPRDGADCGRILTVQKDRPTSVTGSTDVLYSPDRSCPDEWRDARRLRYASAQHLPQSRGAGGGGARPAPAEQWPWGSPLAAPLSDGYVYPEYQPPRQEQPWPSAGAPPTRADRAPVYRSTPNLYRPQAPAPSAPTLSVRQAQQWALYQQQQQQQQQVGWRGRLGPAADQQYRSPPAQPHPSRPFSSSDIYPEVVRSPGAGSVPRGYTAGGARPHWPGC